MTVSIFLRFSFVCLVCRVEIFETFTKKEELAVLTHNCFRFVYLLGFVALVLVDFCLTRLSLFQNLPEWNLPESSQIKLVFTLLLIH